MATPLGCGVDTIRKRLIQGDCGIRALSPEDLRMNSFDRKIQLHAYEQLTSKVAAVVPCRTNLGDFNEDLWLNSKEHRSIAGFIGYALCAADEALKDAKWLPTDQEEKKRTGVSIGGGTGSSSDILDAAQMICEKDINQYGFWSREHEMWIPDDTVIDAEIGSFSAALFDDYGGLQFKGSRITTVPTSYHISNMNACYAFDGLGSPLLQRRQLYAIPMSKLRLLMICCMTKVLIIEYENGNIVRETMKDNDVLVQYKVGILFWHYLNPFYTAENSYVTSCTTRVTIHYQEKLHFSEYWHMVSLC
ncbi:hypothetical protein FNV43_RR10432 [Rhamnella rubrinervis]|uniref:beta-ketoacyl-[acyl-carrier-protein] synthase I n=1 Tax=Rhamnella rubrinervis TaxID=2594499 RepID=A0A8K0HBT2_9ROSA|nr:hypothetical protein FNV43_RR10432 [Rhamnella rubrinervis]